MTDTKTSLCQRIEEFFAGDEKPKKACLNLLDYLFSSETKIKGLSMMDVAEVMDSEDPKTVLVSIEYCSGQLGLINTYAEVVFSDDKTLELTTEELNQAVRCGRATNPRTGLKEMFSHLTHPLYKAGQALIG